MLISVIIVSLDILEVFATQDQLFMISTALCSRRLSYMDNIKDSMPTSCLLSPLVEDSDRG